MNTLTVQNLIIGLSVLSFSIAITVLQFEYLRIWRESPTKYNAMYDEHIALKLAKCAGAITVCLLQIWGTLWKRPLALIPFILCVIGTICFTLLYNGFNFMWMQYGHFPFVMSIMLVIGMEVLALYTICSLFRQIWIEKKKKTVEKQNPNYYDKV